MNQSRKREFKAPWKEPEQSMHETVTTPAHLSQKWMDTFSFGEKSRKNRLFDQESKETQKQSDTMGSQKQRVCCVLMMRVYLFVFHTAVFVIHVDCVSIASKFA